MSTRAEKVLYAIKTRGPLSYAEITEELTGYPYVSSLDSGIAGNLIYGDSKRTGLLGKFLRQRKDGRFSLVRKTFNGPFSSTRANAKR